MMRRAHRLRADPEPFIDALEGVDIGVTSDCLSREADADKAGTNPRFTRYGTWFCGHNPGNTFGSTFNTGVLLLSPSDRAREFTRKWEERLRAPTDDWHLEDQASPPLPIISIPRRSISRTRAPLSARLQPDGDRKVLPGKSGAGP